MKASRHAHRLPGGGRRAGAAAGRVPLAAWLLVIAGLTLAGCRQDMHDQPRYEPLETSDFFVDGRASRPLIEGTVARGELREDSLLFTGKVDGKDSEVFPFPVTEEVLRRGRER
ncbi:MAG: hypothetical protein EHM13_11755, partial [Acidobacteria bacterium]